jgi:branched-chain amino acid transport system permease protein
MGSQVAFFGLGLDTASASAWLAVCAVLLVGGWVFALAQRRFSKDWGAVQEAIERETQATGAAL